MSAVAAVAVASPFAVTALTASPQPAPEKHDFVQAAMVTDLPGEIMSALQSSLSQFGIVVPNIPSGILGPANTPASSSLTAPGGLTATPSTLTAPGLTATTPGLNATTPGLTTPTTPAITSPTSVLGDPALANPSLTPGTATLTAPSVTTPTTPGLTTPTTPGLTTPTTPLTTPSTGLTTPTAIDPALTSPLGATPGLTGVPGEVPISAPLGPDGLPGYPVADPMLSMPMTATPAPASGGLLSELSSAVDQLGASQAIDLLKGVVVPSIMQAIKSAPAAAAAAPAPAAPTP